MKKINAIYARQSVDRADSNSIESQIEFCRKKYGQVSVAAASCGYSNTKLKENPQVQRINADIDEIEREISVLVESLLGAGETLTNYINRRVEQLDQLRQEKMKKMVVLAENHATPEQMERVVSNISLWNQIEFDEKRFTVDKMIALLRVSSESIQIQWKF